MDKKCSFGEVVVGRPIEGVTINGLEYLCDENGYAIVFKDEADAKQFLADHGLSEDDIEDQGILIVEE